MGGKSVIGLLSTFVLVVSAMAATIGLFVAVLRFQNELKKRKILGDQNAEGFVTQYNDEEIRLSVLGYVPPHCSPIDPANREQDGYLADTRENIFEYFDRAISNSTRSYHLLLADTGMGKTAFCINYFYHLKNKKPRRNVCLVSLASKGYKAHIRKVPNKENCIIILDAFDELAAGYSNSFEVFHNLIKSCEDFRAIIVTCRSQFFQGEDFIPYETQLSNINPKGINANVRLYMTRSYISPFDRKEIKKYIAALFPLWKPWVFELRKKALKLVEDVPDLVHRPMLLEQLPLLVSSEQHTNEIFDLYTVLVDGWIAKERKWIPEENLLKASFEIAYQLYCVRFEDRATSHDIVKIAELALGESPDWTHLSTRSLLNCDSRGRYKFAHRSILEYLLVRMAIGGDLRALEASWTPFMKELFVSWGHSDKSEEAVLRAKEILKSKLARENLYPLYEVWLGNTLGARTKIERVISGHTTSDGQRLAPKAWRDPSIILNNRGNNPSIRDLEFNIHWVLPREEENYDHILRPNVKYVEMIAENNSSIRLPYVDEIVALLDATENMGQSIIRDGDRFLLADYLSSRQKLLAHIGDYNKNNSPSFRVFSNTKKIRGTGRKITILLTGVDVSINYHRSFVRELYIKL